MIIERRTIKEVAIDCLIITALYVVGLVIYLNFIK